MKYVENSLLEAQIAINNFCSNYAEIIKIYKSIDLMVECIKNGGHIFSCGNGGSMTDAMHFAEELSGRYRLNRPALPGIAISDSSHVSCVANDFGYNQVFSRFIEANVHSNDIVLAISTSGKSENVISALKVCKERQIKSILLTGQPNSPCENLATISIVATGGIFADRVQELHIKIIHILIEGIERNLFPNNYK